MSIINRPYQHETDFKKVSEFLINHYLPGNADGNWLEPEWECANFHPMLDQDHMHLWRIWEDDGEMVATDPDYRRLRLGKAAVLEGIRRCAELGAKEAFVGSDQLFYQTIGFQKVYNTECWVKYLN